MGDSERGQEGTQTTTINQKGLGRHTGFSRREDVPNSTLLVMRITEEVPGAGTIQGLSKKKSKMQ